MSPAEWIAVVWCSPEVEAKLRAKHDVTIREVREAISYGSAEVAAWDNHPEFGWRLLVRGTTYEGRPLTVVLGEVDRTDGVWECKTARRWEGR